MDRAILGVCPFDGIHVTQVRRVPQASVARLLATPSVRPRSSATLTTYERDSIGKRE